MLGTQESVFRLADVEVREGGVRSHQDKLGGAGRAHCTGSPVPAAQFPKALHSDRSLYAWTRSGERSAESVKSWRVKR